MRKICYVLSQIIDIFIKQFTSLEQKKKVCNSRLNLIDLAKIYCYYFLSIYLWKVINVTFDIIEFIKIKIKVNYDRSK